jgi:hypothetical protein
MGFNTATPGSGGTRTSWFEIYESQHEQMRGKGGSRSPLALQDLRDHLTEVHALGDRLRAFLCDVLIPQTEKEVASTGDMADTPPPNA